MNIDKYKTFLACAEADSFQDAAATLGITPSAVSKHIASLEKEYGCTLFDRSSKKLLLTREGEIRLPVVRQIVYGLNRLMMISDTEPQELSSLTVPASPPFFRYGLNDMVNTFNRENPDLFIHIREEPTILAPMLKGTYQIAFLNMLPQRDAGGFDIISFPIGNLGVLVPDGHPLAAVNEAEPEDLFGALVCAQDSLNIKTVLENYFSSSSFYPEIEYVLPREDALLMKVTEEHRMAFVTSDVVRVYRPRGCVFVPLIGENTVYGQLVRLKNFPLGRSAERFYNYAAGWIMNKRGGVHTSS